MARKPTLAGKTNTETDAIFRRAVETLGMRVDARVERRNAILIDGLSIGDRQGEMRKPDTSFYEKRYAEANAVAHLAVNLDFDRTGKVDVRRLPEPQPDTQLTIEGQTIAFIEQTQVMDQGAHRLSLEVEALNLAARQATDPDIVKAFSSGILTLRLDGIPERYYNGGFPKGDILNEIFALARTLDRDCSEIKADPADMPLLAEMKLFGTYRTGGKTVAPVMSLVDHGRNEVLRDAILDQLKKKRRTAGNYPKECRPLWLLLNIDIHFGCSDFSSIAKSAIEAERPTGYDRIIVDQTYAKPLVVDFEREP